MIPPDLHRLFRRLLTESHDVVLTTHINPDGDAIGSQIALARYLSSRGARVRIINGDPTPQVFRFLEDETHRVEVFDPGLHAAPLSDAGLLVLLDNSAPDRLGHMESVVRGSANRVLCIDHHPTRVTPWGHNVLDEEACATACMIHELITSWGWSPEPRIAEALFVGIVTDTGFFRFNSTTARAYEIAAQLVRAGVEPARCFERVYERNSEPYTRLLGHALADVRFDEGCVASIRVTRDLIARCGAEGEDLSEMTTPLLAMDGVRIAILFREVADGKVKVSLRSKGALDVRLLAAEFGGGGHRNASGIVMGGTLGEVEERVLGRAIHLASS